MLPTTQQKGASAEGMDWSARLAGTNINPKTFLATDYLNHFNEVIMLLEMLDEIPSCAVEIAQWRPMSYIEHFQASGLADRELAIEAYAAAPDTAREGLRLVVNRLNARILEAQASLAKSADPVLRRLVELAGLVINGSLTLTDEAELNGHLLSSSASLSQDSIDSLFD